MSDFSAEEGAVPLAPGDSVTATKWQCKAGSFANLKPVKETIAVSAIPPGHVLVRVMSCGMNFADVFAVQGLYSATPQGLFTPGLEFGGVVAALPADATAASPVARPATPPAEADAPVAPASGSRGRKRKMGGASASASASTKALRSATGAGRVSTTPNANEETGAAAAATAGTVAVAAYRGFRVGQRVMGVIRFGGYASYVVADVRTLRPLPDGWSFHSGAGFICQALTAYYGMCHLARLTIPTNTTAAAATATASASTTTVEGRADGDGDGDADADSADGATASGPAASAPSKTGVSAKPSGPVILIHSAAGGVGLYALALAERLPGARVIATVSSLAKVKHLIASTSLHRQQILVRPTGTIGVGRAFGAQLDGALKFLGASGIDVVMDSLLGPYFQPAYDRLNKEGQLVVFGAGSMTTAGDSPSWLRLAYRYVTRPAVDPLQIIAENRTVHGFNLIWCWDKLDALSAMLDHLIALGLPPPHVSRTFSFLPERVPATATATTTATAAAPSVSAAPASNSFYAAAMYALGLSAAPTATATTASAAAAPSGQSEWRGGAPAALRYFQSGTNIGKICLDVSALHRTAAAPVADAAAASAAVGVEGAEATPDAPVVAVGGESDVLAAQPSASASSASAAASPRAYVDPELLARSMPFDPTDAAASAALAAETAAAEREGAAHND